jgi:uncharacterized protein YkwD
MSENLFNITNNTCNWRTNSHSVQKYQFIYHFLPHPHENRRASLLSVKALAFYCVMVMVFSIGFKTISTLFPDVLGYATNINVTDLLQDTNKIRKENGLNSLRLNTALSEAARQKAEHMFKEGYWAHVAPDGTEPWDFILKQNYDYTYAGENLAKNFSVSDEVVEAWYNSPSHRENLLGTHYTEIGFAVVNGKLNGYETTLVVQMFGRPRQASQLADIQATDDIPSVSAPIAKVDLTKDSKTPTNENGVTKVNTVISKEQQAVVKPLMDIRLISRSFTVLFGSFILLLLSLDVWYSAKKGIVKLSGHTLVHMSFLILALVGIWFVLNPGSVL